MSDNPNSIDAIALAIELDQRKKRMLELKKQHAVEQSRCEEIYWLLNQHLREFIPEVDNRFKEAEARMLKSASRVITEKRKSRQAENYAREAALTAAKDIAAKYRFRDVTPRVKEEIEAKIKSVYSPRPRTTSPK